MGKVGLTSHVLEYDRCTYQLGDFAPNVHMRYGMEGSRKT